MSSKKTDRFINIFPKYFRITVDLNVSLQFYFILFNSQTYQQGNSPLALWPLRRSYQVLLYQIKQKWYQTYSRLKTLILIWKWLLSFVILQHKMILMVVVVYFYFKNKLQRRRMMWYFKRQILFLIQFFCYNFPKVFLICVNPRGRL